MIYNYPELKQEYLQSDFKYLSNFLVYKWINGNSGTIKRHTRGRTKDKENYKKQEAKNDKQKEINKREKKLNKDYRGTLLEAKNLIFARICTDLKTKTNLKVTEIIWYYNLIKTELGEPLEVTEKTRRYYQQKEKEKEKELTEEDKAILERIAKDLKIDPDKFIDD